MCGELASMRKAIPILVGLGLDELSMAPASIPEAKALIAMLERERVRRLAEEVLPLGEAADVEAMVERFLIDLGWPLTTR
jgi:phosphoenolpyruvate-protein kinase (PTS system EI component)